jgi:hypothetical protein
MFWKEYRVFTIVANTEFNEIEIFSDLEMGHFSGLDSGLVTQGVTDSPTWKNFRPENYSLTKVIK